MEYKTCRLIDGPQRMGWYNLSGVYIIYCSINSKVYIGSSKNIGKRITSHKNRLLKGDHHSIALQAAVNKHGFDNFLVKILENCEPEDLQETEQKYLDRYQSFKRDKGYNIAKAAYVGNLGYNHSDDAKKKISAASKKMWEKNREKLVSSLKNRSLSAQSIEKIRIAHQKFKYKYEYLDHLYNERNLNKREIADLLGCTERTVKDNFHRMGLRKSKEKWLEQLKAKCASTDTVVYQKQILMYWEQGLKYKEIARKLGISVNVIGNTIFLNNKSRKQKFSFKRILDDTDGKVYSLKEISEKYNMREDTIREQFRENRLQLKLKLLS